MHGACAVLITAERFQRQRQQLWLLFGKHGRHLPFGSAVDARIGPARFPMVQVSLRFRQTLKPLSFERCFLRMTDAGFNLTFAIRVAHPAGHGDHAVVGQQITVERIERGIVNVRSEHALAQIVEHHDPHTATQPAKRFLMELGPDARAGTEYQQPYRLATVAERHHEQPRAAVLAALGFADHGASAVIDLCFFARSGDDHRPRLQHLSRAEFVDEAFDALVAVPKALLSHQVLPDSHRIATAVQSQLDDFTIRLTIAH